MNMEPALKFVRTAGGEGVPSFLGEASDGFKVCCKHLCLKRKEENLSLCKVLQWQVRTCEGVKLRALTIARRKTTHSVGKESIEVGEESGRVDLET